MSAEQNIQTVQAAYAAFVRGDMQTLISTLDENIEWVTPEIDGIPETGTKHGHAGAREFFQSVNAIWEFEIFEPREFIASGDRVAVQGHYRMKSRQTGLVGQSDWVMVFRFRDGKCVHYQEYTDTAALRQAATGARTAGA